MSLLLGHPADIAGFDDRPPGAGSSHSCQCCSRLIRLLSRFLELSFNAMAQSLVQINAPADMRGRVIGLFNMASLGLRAFSGISVGLLRSLIGIHWSLALSALATMIVAGTAGDAVRKPVGYGRRP
jgi:hypothetical protein